MHRPNLFTATITKRRLITRSCSRRGLPVVISALTLGLFASSAARAVTPAPDGGYPGENTAEGDGALQSRTYGIQNTAIGFQALLSLTNAASNTALGFQALASNTTGNFNTATGRGALGGNTTGNFNTASGIYALFGNTTGIYNTANGANALSLNETGLYNTANGANALYANTTGSNNTANGVQALLRNTGGFSNTANGGYTLADNTTGYQNTATGIKALRVNTSGIGNVAEGNGALGHNTTGSFNTALGSNAGANLTTGRDNIDIGAVGVAGESNTLRIGYAKQTATYVAGIYGATEASGLSVVVGPNGHLGTVQSSARYKEAIKPMDAASEAILALKPVTFRYKHDLDPNGIPQFGLVAEQVAKVNPGLVARDTEGKVCSVRYEAVNAMLLNEFLKEHRKVEKLEKQIEALTATVQKVSEEMLLNKPNPQVVVLP